MGAWGTLGRSTCGAPTDTPSNWCWETRDETLDMGERAEGKTMSVTFWWCGRDLRTDRASVPGSLPERDQEQA